MKQPHLTIGFYSKLNPYSKAINYPKLYFGHRISRKLKKTRKKIYLLIDSEIRNSYFKLEQSYMDENKIIPTIIIKRGFIKRLDFRDFPTGFKFNL